MQGRHSHHANHHSVAGARVASGAIALLGAGVGSKSNVPVATHATAYGLDGTQQVVFMDAAAYRQHDSFLELANC